MKLALSTLPRTAPRRDTSPGVATGHARSRRSGFSLLEVALALAIFLIGALAIIRIFPGGLSSVAQSENSLRASDINKAALARLTDNKSIPASVFYGALPNYTDPSPALPQIPTPFIQDNTLDAAVLGPTRANNSLPKSSLATDFYDSALMKQLTITGEAEPVAYDSANTTYYVLTQFPIAFRRDEPASAGITGSGSVNVFEEDNLEDVQIGTNGRLDLSKARFARNGELFTNPDTAVTTDADSVCTANPKTCAFYVSYRFKDPEPTLSGFSGARDEAVAWNVPTGGTTGTATTRFGTAGIVSSVSAVPGTVQVRFRHWLNTEAVDTAHPENGHLGYMPLKGVYSRNPTLTTNPLLTASSLDDLPKVTLDYQAGWGTYSISQDIPSLTPQTQYAGSANLYDAASAPSSGEAQIALNAPFTFARGTLPLCALVNDSSTISTISFTGATKDAVPAAAASDLILKPDSEITPLAEADQAVAYNERRYALQTGRLTFDMNNKPNRNVRVAYATRDSWVQQLAVACSSYTRTAGAVGLIPPTAPEQWRDYAVPANDNYIYFKPSEAGKTVQVTYGDSNSKDPVTIVGTIEPRIRENPIPADFPGSTKVARLRLYEPAGNPLPPARLTGILDIKGLSVSMRTAWLERNRWTQNITTTMRRESQ